MDNYIVINGKKAELTEEQLKKLGIKVEKETPFARNKPEGNYYYISARGIVEETSDDNDFFDQGFYDSVNYFRDKNLAQQVALHQLLYRKLLKYAWDNEGEDAEWDGETLHYYILFDSKDCLFTVNGNRRMQNQNIYFSKRYVAEQAIKDVIEPFMKEHSEFVW